MYLHLGQGEAVPEGDIIGVFDADNTTGSRITRDFLSRAEKDGRIVPLFDDLPKAFVVCSEKVYLTQLGTATLMKRAESNGLE